MKKIISIILVVAMLASMAIVAVPASAASTPAVTPIDPATVGNNKIDYEDNFEYMDELDAQGYIPIVATRTGFEPKDAVLFSEVVSGNKYYLYENITVNSEKNGQKWDEEQKKYVFDKYPTNIIIDGCGATIELTKSLFDTPSNITLKNVTITGRISNSNEGWVGSVMARWDMKGYLNLENVTLSDDFVISSTTCDRGKLLSKFAGYVKDDKNTSVFKNVYAGGTVEYLPYTGNKATWGQQIESIGGVVGEAQNIVFENVVNTGKIVIGDGVTDMTIRLKRFDGSGADGGIGGVLGRALTNVTMTNCLNTAEIVIKDKVTLDDTKLVSINAADKDTVKAPDTYVLWSNNHFKRTSEGIGIGGNGFGGIGGVVGRVQGNGVTMTNCHNTGAITLENDNSVTVTAKVSDATSGEKTVSGTVHRRTNVGGVVGYASMNGSLVMKDCSNSGDITLLKAKATGIGGVLGTAEGAGKIDMTNCDNSGAVSAALGQNTDIGMGTAGIFGMSRITNVSMTDCDNSGALTFNVMYAKSKETYKVKNSNGDLEDTRHSFHTSTSGAGGIFGYQYKSGGGAEVVSIRNCHNTGAVIDNASEKAIFLGGIAGGIRGAKTTAISECTNSSALKLVGPSTWASVGGILGQYGSVGNWMQNNNADILATLDIRLCKNTGNIEAYNAVGGILGDNHEVNAKNLVTNIFGCVNEGNVTCKASKTNAGGIYGTCDALGTVNIDYCVNKGAVTSTDKDSSVGGIISSKAQDSSGKNPSKLSITNSKNEGAITGGKYVAGIAANMQPQNSMVIENCYNAGAVKAQGNTEVSIAGGIIGFTTTKGAKIDKCINAGSVSSLDKNYSSPIAPASVTLATDVSNIYLKGCVASDVAVKHGAASEQSAITTAVNKIVFSVKGNAYYLKVAIGSVSVYIESDYEKATWTTLSNALKAAKDIENSITTEQAKFNSAQKVLEDAIKGLVPKALDLSKYQPAIDAFNNVVENEWTGASYLAVKNAVRNVDAIKAQKGALQSKFDQAIQAIYTAIDELEPLGDINGEIDVDQNGDFTLPPLRPQPTASSETSNSTTSATTTAATTTTPPEEKGCGGIIGGAAVVLAAVAAIGTGISLKKRED